VSRVVGAVGVASGRQTKPRDDCTRLSQHDGTFDDTGTRDDFTRMSQHVGTFRDYCCVCESLFGRFARR